MNKKKSARYQVGLMSYTSYMLALVMFMLTIPVKILSAPPNNSLNESLKSMTMMADLVFIGRIDEIEYRNSDQRNSKDAVLPHTFVTYEIERILSGTYQNQHLTLRFLGGANSINGKVLLPQTFPLFSLGNRDILFVRGNGQSVCPLVGCLRGRFRVVDDKVYTDRGRGLAQTTEGQVVLTSTALESEQIKMEVPPAPDTYLASERERLKSLKKTLDPEAYDQQVKRLKDLSNIRVIALQTNRSQPPYQSKNNDAKHAEANALIKLLSQLKPNNAKPAASVANLSVDQPFYILRPAPKLKPKQKEDPHHRQSVKQNRLRVKR